MFKVNAYVTEIEPDNFYKKTPIGKPIGVNCYLLVVFEYIHIVCEIDNTGFTCTV